MKAQFFLSLSLCFFSFADGDQLKVNTIETENFQPFTGKINSKQVRIRTAPDVESTIITTYNEDHFVTVLGKVDDFYAVEPDSDVKFYIYRNFVVDGKIEGNNVNVRLAPDLNSPIVAKLQQGDFVTANTCKEHTQWMEINVPKDIEFFVAGEYVEKVGSVDMLEKMDAEKEALMSKLDALKSRIENETKLPYESMDLRECEQLAEKLLEDLDHESVLEVRDMLHKLKESYLSKKIASLEMQLMREELPESMEQNIEPLTLTLQNVPEEYRVWHKKEFDRFLTWSQSNPSKSFDTFLTYEKDGATLISGTIERFECDVEDIPGNYLLIQNGYPVAYLYCLDSSLEENVGKETSFLAQPRSNLDFAFPTYVVLEIK